MENTENMENMENMENNGSVRFLRASQFSTSFLERHAQLVSQIKIYVLFFNRLTASRHLANTRVAWLELREMRRFLSPITRIRLTHKEIRYTVRNIKLNGRWKHLAGSSSSSSFPLKLRKERRFLRG